MKKPKGIKTAVLVLFLHLLVILLSAGYVFCIKFPVVIWDDGLFLNSKFISSEREFLLTTLKVWFGVPVLIAVANAVFAGHVSRKYLQYVGDIRQKCTTAEAYFREQYPEQQEAIARTTYFSGRIALLQTDAQNLRIGNPFAVFSNLRRCRNLEKEFRELVRRCEQVKTFRTEQELARNLHREFRSLLQYSAVLLHQYFPEQMQKSFSALEQYLARTAGNYSTERVFKENPYSSDTDFLLAELYAPLETLAQNLQSIAEYLRSAYPQILKKNSTSGMEILPLPEDMQTRPDEISALLKKIPNGKTLLSLSAQKDKNAQKRLSAYHEKFRSYQATVSAYDSCIGLYYQYIADIEHKMLEQLLAHYRIVQNAYRMYFPEDSPRPQEFAQAFAELKAAADAGTFTWHLYYLPVFSQTQNKAFDISLTRQDDRNLQCRLDAVRTCAETINQIIRKDEKTA